MAQIPGRANDNQLEPKSIKRSFPEVSENAKIKEIVEEIPARAWWQVRLVHIFCQIFISILLPLFVNCGF